MDKQIERDIIEDVKSGAWKAVNHAFIGLWILVPLGGTLYRVGESLGGALTP